MAVIVNVTSVLVNAPPVKMQGAGSLHEQRGAPATLE